MRLIRDNSTGLQMFVDCDYQIPDGFDLVSSDCGTTFRVLSEAPKMVSWFWLVILALIALYAYNRYGKGQ